MKHTAIKILALSAVGVIGWNIGGVIPAHTMTLFGGFIFGAFVGIPAMLIIATRAQTVRHDHYVHTAIETATQQTKQAEWITAKPTRYTVVNVLPTVAQNKIGVSK